MRRGPAVTVKKLCAEVIVLTAKAIDEGCGNPAYASTTTRGALRRRSMDLTRALADLRRP